MQVRGHGPPLGPSLTRSSFQHAHILRLPPELHMMIFECLVDEKKAWLVSLVTLCKALGPEVEAVLYREVVIKTCKRTSTLCRSVIKGRCRAVYMRKLVVSIRGGASIKQHLKRALPMLTNLAWLELEVGDTSIFDILLDVPFRLRTLLICGCGCSPHLEDILARQPDIERLSLLFSSDGLEEQVLPRISRPDILQKLHTLVIMAGFFPFTGITYAYPISHLAVIGARHDDLTHIVGLFSSTLVTLYTFRFVSDICTPMCYWPASMFRDAKFPILKHMNVTTLFHHTAHVRIHPQMTARH